MINSRNLKDLTPEACERAEKFIQECDKNNIDILITSTYRDNESQNALYAQGRSISGKIVTNARGGQSFHNYRIAFDFVPIINGKPNWNDVNLFKKCGQIAESVGLEWAGKWTTFKEMAHCQLPGFKIKNNNIEKISK